MCGIAGLATLNGADLNPEVSSAITAMMAKMTRRGPDGAGQILDGAVAFGHRRLSIIDLAGGEQPMSDASGRYWIVFNGEIYNFRELRQELADKGFLFRTKSDTEVILNAYALYGEDCARHLDGMFAFAIWDRQRRKLYCARDPFGEKPFYYTIQRGLFAFASELGPLATARASLGFTFHTDPHALMRYLAYEYVPTPQGIYREVKTLEPAHWIALENGSVKIRRYWDLPTPLAIAPAPEAELAEELGRLMKRSVAMRMVSDVPLGVFLSGGIDSTIVAGLMAEVSPTPIQTFSIGFREASYDESAYARIAAKAYGTIHHERILSAEECADELPGIVSDMDTPMADASCAPTWLLAALARQHVTVALGGDGADELWAGYEHYIGFRLAQCYNALPKWIRSRVLEPLAAILPTSAGYINPRLAARAFLNGCAAPDWLRVQTILTAIGPETQAKILNPAWLDAAGREFLEIDRLFAPTRTQYEHWLPAEAATPLARAFHVYARQFMLDDILVKVDRCSMLHSLEVRAPFLGREVAEFVARLPLNCKLRGFKRKFLLKKAFARLLPPKILRRNKRGFQIPVSQWLRGKLKPMLMDLLAANRLRVQGIFSPEAVMALVDAHLSGREDLRKPLWTLLVFQLWCDANRPDF